MKIPDPIAEKNLRRSALLYMYEHLYRLLLNIERRYQGAGHYTDQDLQALLHILRKDGTSVGVIEAARVRAEREDERWHAPATKN